MRQVLLVALGTHGDVLPILALAVELKRRGHDAVLAAPAPFARMAERAALPFHALCTQEEYDRFTAEPDLWRPWRGAKTVFEAVSAMTEPTYRWIVGQWRGGDGVVVASTLCLGARVAQDKFALPVVTVHVMPFLVESRLAPPELPGLHLPELLPRRLRHGIGRGADKYVIGPAALPRLNAFRATLDLPPVRRLRHWWNSPLRVLLTFSDWFAPPQLDWPRQVAQVGFPIADHLGDTGELSPDLSSFLDAGEAPLAFTYGSAMRQSRPFFETAVAICARMGRRGLFLAPESDQVPHRLPPGMMRVAYAPFSRVLPRCAALVHHGGVGTVAQALAAGIPQLVVPVAFDHFDEGRRLRRLGVGATLGRRRFTPRRAAATIRGMLADPTLARACAAAMTRMRAEDGVRDACDVIERVAAGAA